MSALVWLLIQAVKAVPQPSPEEAVAAEVVAVSASIWTPAMIAAVTTAIVSVIGAFTTMMVTILNTRKEATATRVMLTAKVEEVHELVNSTDTANLERVAAALVRIADITKKPADRVIADAAVTAVTEKNKVTAEAKAKKEAALKVPDKAGG